MLSDSEAKTLAQRLDHLEDMIRRESDQRVSDTLALNAKIKALSNRIEAVTQNTVTKSDLSNFAATYLPDRV